MRNLTHYLAPDGCDIESCPKCGGQALGCECNMAQHILQIRATIAGSGKKKTVIGMGFTEAQARADDLQIDEACVRGLTKWIKEREAQATACDESAAKLDAAAPNLALADNAREKAAKIREAIGRAKEMLADSKAKVAAGKSQRDAEMERIANHDCEDEAVEYESDGALGHGWECGVCGRFLQAG